MTVALNNILGEIEKALGEYAPVIETDCPAWALFLKEAEEKVIEAIEEIESGGENPHLEKLWKEFISWDNGANGADDNEAERYATYKGAVGHQVIAFMAFVEGRSGTKAETEAIEPQGVDK